MLKSPAERDFSHLDLLTIDIHLLTIDIDLLTIDIDLLIIYIDLLILYIDGMQFGDFHVITAGGGWTPRGQKHVPGLRERGQ